jgi:ribosomal protein S18 acetylase RimI-like enzyme
MATDAARGAVRAAAAGDEQDFLAMWQDFVRTGPEPCAPEAAAHVWRSVMDPGNPLQGLMAVDDGRPVGFAVYLSHPYTWSPRPVCYLLDLYVRPEARGRGHGRALMDSLVEVGRREGWLRIHWMTQEDNTTARALYDKIARRAPLVRYDLYLAEH